MIKSDKILLRSGTAASWSATNPKLELGEIGYEIDTRKIKVGDGEYKWNGLSYIYTGDANAAGTSGQVQFNNGGLLGTNANFFWDNAQSFLGVGTATPTSKLTVRGGAITVGNTDAQVTQLAADGSNVGYVGTTTNTPFAIRTNGSNNRVWVTETGNVGIGVTSPQELLDVNGAIKLGTNGSQTSIVFPSGSALRTNAVGSNVFFDVGNLYIRQGNGVSAGATLTVRGNTLIGESNIYSANLTIANNLSATSIHTYNTFTDASNYERAKFAWSSNVLQIGTEKLGTGVARTLALQTDGTNRMIVSTTGNIGINQNGSIRGRLDVYGLDSEVFIGNDDAQSLVMGNSRRLNYGDFLIAKNLAGVAASDSYRTVFNSAATGYCGIELRYPGDIAFYGQNGATTGGATVTPITRMMIKGDTGNVGIGTATPSTLLEVSGTNANNIIRSTTTSNIGTTAWAGVTAHEIQFYNADPSGAGLYSAIRIIGSADSGVAAGGTAHYDYTVWTGGYNRTLAERMRIDSSGNVGIGNSTPTERLVVNGNVNAARFISTQATGTAPFTVSSTTAVTNLNADLLDGQHGSYYTNYVQSRLENLVTNGSGLLGNNTNFSSMVFNAVERFSGGGSFTWNGADNALTNDELIPVDIGRVHKFSYYIKLLSKSVPSETPTHYGMIVSYDADGNAIVPYNCQKVIGSTYTTLAAPLNPGDTTITLTDAAGWNSGVNSHQRSIGFYPYTNLQGYTYPDYTYTRDYIVGAWNQGGITGNVITLAAPYAGVARPAGTKVANIQSGGTYDYIAGGNATTPTTWTKFEGIIGPIGAFYATPTAGQIVSSTGDMYSAPNGFRQGVAFVKIGWLLSYNTPVGTAHSAVSAVSFGQDPRHDDYYRSVSDGTALSPAFSFANDTDIGIFRPLTNELGFATTGSERLRIDASGNVVIGATSTTERLRVAGGNILLDSGNGVRCPDNFRLYDTTSSIDRFLFSTNNSYNTRSGGSHLFNINGSQIAVLTSSGNMGLGVGSPTARLDVSNGSSYSMLLRAGDSSGGTSAIQIAFGYGNTADYRHSIRTRHNSGAAANNAIDFWLWQQGVDAAATLGSLRVMTIDGANGGSVGIGNASPAYRLYTEVNSNTPGNATVGLGIRNINAGTAADTRLYLGHDTSPGAAAIIMHANAHSTRANELAIVNAIGDATSKITFATNNSVERMRIDGAGNVGIGVTNPSEKLHVADSLMFAQGTTALACKSYIINRSVSATAGDTTEIGSFLFTNGAGYIELDIVSHVGAYSISAKYLLPIQYANDEQAQNNVWLLALPVSYSGNYNSNQVNLDINVNNGTATLRLRRVSGAQIGVHAINIKTVGNSVTFTPSTTTATGVSTPTLIYGATALIQRTNKVGINTFSPGSTLDVKGTLRLSGATSGYVGLAPASAAGSITYTLPSADGTSGQFLRTNGSGTLSWGAAGSATIYSPTTTTTITELSGEVVVLADATSGSLTVNLPTAVSNTAKITVKKIDSSANTVVIDGNSTQTIDGSLTKTIEFQYTSVTLISNGSNWFII